MSEPNPTALGTQTNHGGFVSILCWSRRKGGRMRVPLFRSTVSRSDCDVFADVLDSGHLTSGAKGVEFEAAFAECLNAEFAIATNSGTAALHLALGAIPLEPGDIVFVPTMAFAADIQVVEWLGAIPVLIDSEPHTLCMDPEKLEQAILDIKGAGNRSGSPPLKGKLRAVLVVDYAGQMADYGHLSRICAEHGLVLIEDACHALPAAWRAGPNQPWQTPGSVAQSACFSFYPNKPITTGEGGMVVTNDSQRAAMIRAMRGHGFGSMSSHSEESNWCRQVVMPGYKYNLPDLAAALGIRQLAQVHHFAEARRRLAASYSERLRECPFLNIPKELPDRQHAWHLYPIQLAGSPDANRRNAIVRELHARGVETSVHWYPLHMHEYYRERIPRIQPLPVAEDAYPRLISLPLFPSMTQCEQEFVVSTVVDVLGSFSPDPQWHSHPVRRRGSASRATALQQR